MTTGGIIIGSPHEMRQRIQGIAGAAILLLACMA